MARRFIFGRLFRSMAKPTKQLKVQRSAQQSLPLISDPANSPRGGFSLVQIALVIPPPALATSAARRQPTSQFPDLLHFNPQADVRGNDLKERQLKHSDLRLKFTHNGPHSIQHQNKLDRRFPTNRRYRHLTGAWPAKTPAMYSLTSSDEGSATPISTLVYRRMPVPSR